jgi:hypothetical protein
MGENTLGVDALNYYFFVLNLGDVVRLSGRKKNNEATMCNYLFGVQVKFWRGRCN